MTTETTGTTLCDWIRTGEKLPPEGEAVQTMSSAGKVQRLVLDGKLWFFPDMSMYVYYTPKYWRHD